MTTSEGIWEWRARMGDRAARLEAAPNFVYRAFDSYGLLLYVGCSVNVRNRMATHRRESDWHAFAGTVAISGPYSRSDAMARERQSIETEAPYFNSSMANHRLVQLRDPRATSHADRRANYLAAREAICQERAA